MRNYNLEVEFEKFDLSDDEIDELYENAVHKRLHAATGETLDGYVDMTVTVESTSFVAAVALVLDRMPEVVDWKVRKVTIQSTLDFDKQYGLDTVPGFGRAKKASPWWRRILSRG